MEAVPKRHRHEVGKLLLLARYFARRATTIAINANAAKTTAAMPIFFICSHLPKD
jgi:hypothetical protein